MTNRDDTQPLHVPRATYRLQLNRDFPFSEAAGLAGYLAALGISDLYLSPVLAARAGSVHGYDVVDHGAVSPELGGEEGLAALAAQAQAQGLSMIADIVPNHMCVAGGGNRWWWDVLENGPSSVHARHFDIDWNPPKEELKDRVLLPVLGEQFGRVLEAGHLRLHFEDGAFHASAYSNPLPLGPRSWRLILEPALKRLGRSEDEKRQDVLELESILMGLRYLPPRTETAEARVHERQREKEVLRRRLAALSASSEQVRRAIEETVEEINGRRDDPRSFDRLEEILRDQAYRLCYWRVATDEINYRRFFDINDLAAIRVEDQQVFESVHEWPLEMVRRGWVKGFRIDHPDGLFEPERYYNDLQRACREAAGSDRRFYVVAEKILTGDEQLRPQWAIEGTTGYGFMNTLNGVFVDARRRRAFLRLYSRFSGWTQSFRDMAYEAKKLILQVSMSSELNVLARRLDRISEQHRFDRDFTLENQREALREFIACFPIYRTYIDADCERPDEEDERHIRLAVKEAKRRNPAMNEPVLDFIQSVFLLDHPDGLTPEQREERRQFVMRVQQFSGAVMAKGLEDTVFYRYFPLASLNEVGGHPEHFGTPVQEFHAKNIVRAEHWPNAMAATSTHDSKRSEDVRARTNVLSEMPGEWYQAIVSWAKLNAPLKPDVAGEAAPSANDEYLLYQTMAGFWPTGVPSPQEHAGLVLRVNQYMVKAMREAKVHSSWMSPNEEYENAVRRFIEGALRPSPDNAFLRSFGTFIQSLHRPGMLNSLAQVLMKAASPGVPDFYQGTELWDFSLVDPDNRRPVDYGVRRRMLERMLAREREAGRETLLRELAENMEDGAVKMHATRVVLAERAARPDLFARGSYAPVRPVGAKAEHVIAFARRRKGQTAVAATGRLFAGLGAAERMPAGAEVWGETVLPLRKQDGAGAWREAISGRTIRAVDRGGTPALKLDEVFRILPVALLIKEADSE